MVSLNAHNIISVQQKTFIIPTFIWFLVRFYRIPNDVLQIKFHLFRTIFLRCSAIFEFEMLDMKLLMERFVGDLRHHIHVLLHPALKSLESAHLLMKCDKRQLRISSTTEMCQSSFCCSEIINFLVKCTTFSSGMKQMSAALLCASFIPLRMRNEANNKQS